MEADRKSPKGKEWTDMRGANPCLCQYFIKERQMNSAVMNGFLAEQEFVLESIKNRWIISRPLLGVEEYDFIADVNKTLYRN